MSTLMYISEIIVALVATIFFSKYKHLPIKTILYILWIAVITESMAKIYSHYYHNNHWAYNLYAFLFYILFYKMVYYHIENTTRKRIVTWLSTAMIIAIIIRAFTVPVVTHYMSIIYNIAMILLVVLLMYYAIDRLKSDAPLRLKNQLELFVFSGYLLFGVTFIPLSPFMVGQMDFQYSRELLNTLRAIQTFSLVVTNIILVFGFIWTDPKKVPAY
ncbi:hypothetical protein [Dokdonia sp. Asnod1-B02]|uniref:hypothetical protein n=1 Tax=Dokdonia sp. Asnod1-B02 TaxID=3160573 RepID=UPI00386BA2BF